MNMKTLNISRKGRLSSPSTFEDSDTKNSALTVLIMLSIMALGDETRLSTPSKISIWWAFKINEIISGRTSKIPVPTTSTFSLVRSGAARVLFRMWNSATMDARNISHGRSGVYNASVDAITRSNQSRRGLVVKNSRVLREKIRRSKNIPIVIVWAPLPTTRVHDDTENNSAPTIAFDGDRSQVLSSWYSKKILSIISIDEVKRPAVIGSNPKNVKILEIRMNGASMALRQGYW